MRFFPITVDFLLPNRRPARGSPAECQKNNFLSVMQITNLTRRQFLAASGMAFSLSYKRQCSLGNDALSFCIALGEGAISARSFENRLVGQSIPLPTEEFLLEFDGGSTISSGSMELRLGATGERAITG